MMRRAIVILVLCLVIGAGIYWYLSTSVLGEPNWSKDIISEIRIKRTDYNQYLEINYIGRGGWKGETQDKVEAVTYIGWRESNGMDDPDAWITVVNYDSGTVVEVYGTDLAVYYKGIELIPEFYIHEGGRIFKL